MKKIIPLIALFFIFNSCSTDNGDNYLFELLPTESVDIPSEFTMGNTYPITIHYKRPTTCHYFNTIYYKKGNGSESNVRTIAVEDAVAQRNNCQELTNEMATYTFNFLVTGNGSYIFKFWQGKDTDGNNIYLEFEVPVTN